MHAWLKSRYLSRRATLLITYGEALRDEKETARDASHTWRIAVGKRGMECNHRVAHIDFIIGVISVCDDVWPVNLLQVAQTVLYQITTVSTVLADCAW